MFDYSWVLATKRTSSSCPRTTTWWSWTWVVRGARHQVPWGVQGHQASWWLEVRWEGHIGSVAGGREQVWDEGCLGCYQDTVSRWHVNHWPSNFESCAFEEAWRWISTPSSTSAQVSRLACRCLARRRWWVLGLWGWRARDPAVWRDGACCRRSTWGRLWWCGISWRCRWWWCNNCWARTWSSDCRWFIWCFVSCCGGPDSDEQTPCWDHQEPWLLPRQGQGQESFKVWWKVKGQVAGCWQRAIKMQGRGQTWTHAFKGQLCQAAEHDWWLTLSGMLSTWTLAARLPLCQHFQCSGHHSWQRFGCRWLCGGSC